MILEHYDVVIKDRTLNITCEAYGYIEDIINSSITWFINDFEVSFKSLINRRAGSRDLVSFDGVRPSIISTLAIPNLEGNYTCMIGNKSATSIVRLPELTVSVPPPPLPTTAFTQPTTLSTLLTTEPTPPPTPLPTPPITPPPTTPTPTTTLPPNTPTTPTPPTPTPPTTLPPTTPTTPTPPITPGEVYGCLGQ